MKKKKFSKILIIPDFHQRYNQAAGIINRHTGWGIGKAFDNISKEIGDFSRSSHFESDKVDRVVFLGDAFDGPRDNPEIIQRMAYLMYELLQHSNFTWIKGDNDCSYIYKSPIYSRPSFSTEKLDIVKLTIGDLLYKNQFAYWTGVTESDPNGFLLSHAGLHARNSPFNDKYMFNWRVIQYALDKAHEDAVSGKENKLLHIPKDRCGGGDYGGITSLNWLEFEPIVGIGQVVGHTYSFEPREVIDINYHSNWCLDTNFKHYAILNIEDLTGEGGRDYSVQKLNIYNSDGSKLNCNE